MVNMDNPFESSEDLTYKAGTILIKPGSSHSNAWLIVNGSVRQYDIHPNGEEITLNIYKQGSVLSLAWILGNGENQYFFEANTDIIIRKIAAKSYKAYLQTHPQAAFKILERLSRGMEGIFSRISANSYNSAHLRILNEIKIEAARFGESDASGSTGVNLSTKDIAHRAGLARETTSRALTELEQNKQISRKGNRIILLV